MIASELMTTLQNLSRADKFQIVQTLIAELAQAEPELISPNQEYPVWSPHNATEAATTMLQYLENQPPATHE